MPKHNPRKDMERMTRVTRARSPVLLLLCLLASASACSNGGASEPPVDEPEDPGLRLSKAGWLRGDLHLHTTYSDGKDSPAMVIAIAEYLEDEVFLAAHPEYRDQGLDFISITDHRTLAVLEDPQWTSDRLILVPGEEFGSPGHANVFGVSELVDHDPGGDGTTLDDIVAGVEHTHAQGGVFSINHPMTKDILWPWDTRAHGAVEIWNTKWGAAPVPPDKLAEWEQANGEASPIFRRALQAPVEQTARFYEAMLARGLHVALVGGSDRHMLFMVGFPTTWIKPDGPGAGGVVAGIRDRHSFVSRTPAAATVELNVRSGALTAQLGDAVPVPAAGAEVTVQVRAGRAEGGRIRLIKGSAAADDDALQTAPLGEVLRDVAIDSVDFTLDSGAITVRPGDWLYPLVLEPLHAPGLTAEQTALVDELALGPFDVGGENMNALIDLFLNFVELDLILNPQNCDPSAWEADMLQCVPLVLDGTPTSTFFVPDWIDRALNALQEAEGPSQWCVGAIGSAIRFSEAN